VSSREGCGGGSAGSDGSFLWDFELEEEDFSLILDLWEESRVGRRGGGGGGGGGMGFLGGVEEMWELSESESDSIWWGVRSRVLEGLLKKKQKRDCFIHLLIFPPKLLRFYLISCKILKCPKIFIYYCRAITID
jgi:hypothetical protein